MKDDLAAAGEVEAPARCPRCGGRSSRVVRGLCPRCLAEGLAGGDPGSGPAAPVAGGLPSPAELEALLDGIVVDGLIGRGGMGAVYRGHQVSLDRPVAVKLLASPEPDNPEFVERFHLEARALARLRHPNIIAVYEYGEAGGFFYILMELVSGRDLSGLVAGDELTSGQALGIASQVAAALDYAHRRGVIHRDIKPSNIIVDRDGNAQIADFGLVKLTGDDGGSGALTTMHERLGTPYYMAPEQREPGGEVDHRADVFALGVVLYEMLTGEVPSGRFAPPSRKARRPLSRRVDPVVLKAVASDPAERFASAAEFRSALAGARRPAHRSPAFLSAGAAVLAALVTWAALSYTWQGQGRGRGLGAGAATGAEAPRMPVLVQGTGLLLDDGFTDGDIRVNEFDGWTLLQFGKAVVLEPSAAGGIRWTPGGSPWGFASLRCHNAFAIPDEGWLEFTWDVSELDADLTGEFSYKAQLCLLPVGVDPVELSVPAGTDELHHFTNTDHPVIAVDLCLYPSAEGAVDFSLKYKDGTARGVHAAREHGMFIENPRPLLDEWYSVAAGRHKVTLRIGAEGFEACWNGEWRTIRTRWTETTFDPPSPAAFGGAVWPLLFGQNGDTDIGGTHVTHRLVVETTGD